MKRVYKLMPYPWYKPEETERWLEEKARNGLFLSKGTVIRFFAAFERQEPKAVRYRLAAPAGHSDGSGTPSGEEVGIAQEMGWTYTARDGEFAVYRCDDTEAPELNTDPEVEAMSLKRIRRRGMSGLFSSIFWLVLLAGLITVGRVWLLLLMDESGWMVLSASLMGLIDLVVSAGKTFRLWKLYRRLKNGRPAKERSLRTPRRTPRVTAAQLGNILALITAVGMMVNCIGMEPDGASLNIKREDEISHNLSCNLGILRWDGTDFSATLDIRYPLCTNEVEILGNITRTVSKYGVCVRQLGSHTPHHVPADHKIVRGLMQVYNELTGDDAKPLAIGGGTYSRMMPNTVAFGVVFPGQEDCCHIADEYIDIERMMQATRIFAHAIAELASGNIA